MCKEGWCSGLGQDLGSLREGEGRDFLKYFKRGWNRKEATRIKTVKTESKLRLGVGAFKKGGLDSP